jgi:hypothetical protein
VEGSEQGVKMKPVVAEGRGAEGSGDKWLKDQSRPVDTSSRPEGYRAFLPSPLPPDPAIQTDEELSRLLSDADRALGEEPAISL